MRTRLDEIVEEETGGNLIRVPNGESIALFSEGVMGKIHRIAERAFRHGVYQHNAYMRGDLATETESRVQPAPAEQNPDLSSIPPRYIDRRKAGERRKDHYTAFATVDITGDRLFSTGMAWKLDRRSGKDRRKK